MRGSRHTDENKITVHSTALHCTALFRFPKYSVGFYGSVDHGHREKMLGKLRRLMDSGMVTYKMGPSKAWIDDM